MHALQRPESRLRRLRLLAWVFAPLLTFPVSYGMALVRAPDAPAWLRLVIGLVTVPVAGVLLSRAIVASAEDLLLARLGTEEERRRRLATPPGRLAHGASRAAVALEAGDVAQAVTLLHAPAIDVHMPPLAVLRIRSGLGVIENRRQPIGHRRERRRALLVPHDGHDATFSKSLLGVHLHANGD